MEGKCRSSAIKLGGVLCNANEGLNQVESVGLIWVLNTTF